MTTPIRSFFLALLCALPACTAMAQLATDGVVHEFVLPNANSGPTTLAIAADGVVWMTLSSGNAIARINPDLSGYQEVALPNPGSSPRIIAQGSDGNMWFSEHTGNRMARITPEGIVTEWDIPTPNSQPRAIALGSDGNIWFSEFKASKIGRITPTGEVTEFNLPRPNSGPGDITAGADGAMWFLELDGSMDGLQPDGNRVGRITMSGEVSEFQLPNDNSTPINIAVGPDRNVWYTKDAMLGRVIPNGRIIEYPVAPGLARTVGLTAGSDRQPPDRLTDKLWFTDGLNNRIGYLQFE